MFENNKELANDKIFVIAAVKENGYLLKNAYDELKKDENVVIEAVKQNYSSLQYADVSLLKNKDFILKAKELQKSTKNNLLTKSSEPKISKDSINNSANDNRKDPSPDPSIEKDKKQEDDVKKSNWNLWPIGSTALKFIIAAIIVVAIICLCISLGLNMDKIKEIPKFVENLKIKEKVQNIIANIIAK